MGSWLQSCSRRWREARPSTFILKSNMLSARELPSLPSSLCVQACVLNAMIDTEILNQTIITHGMPYPTNLSTARSVESIVRSTGAVPATTGLVHGRVKIGLEAHELERLADVENNPGVVKLSRRDLGPAIALRKDGGTTCSSTLIFADLAGIKVCL
jgi:pseudouridine-5'-phosphate glycosidase